ncbi:hypothetical protein B0H21DRAFT_544849 [Amylocystis lapponica]|nr:hypothetical protein B0H21DRAFT_544849 [Amylocystis lapponica]
MQIRGCPSRLCPHVLPYKLPFCQPSPQHRSLPFSGFPRNTVRPPAPVSSTTPYAPPPLSVLQHACNFHLTSLSPAPQPNVQRAIDSPSSHAPGVLGTCALAGHSGPLQSPPNVPPAALRAQAGPLVVPPGHPSKHSFQLSLVIAEAAWSTSDLEAPRACALCRKSRLSRTLLDLEKGLRSLLKFFFFVRETTLLHGGRPSRRRRWQTIVVMSECKLC